MTQCQSQYIRLNIIYKFNISLNIKIEIMFVEVFFIDIISEFGEIRLKHIKRFKIKYA